ncbi:hypothetical protein [Virgibacillus salexigens]|uniref:Uncharacterized protein n=1 Tax=Virgibacillus massiliensis TaxID=1462526 RepID=A0A024QGU4_9BACI|nr:hypothetical protein [Virgibacillus massiliensis]CDQ41778.1 hypothetical protein BN990_04155 [Virgibacillus massiliensis]
MAGEKSHLTQFIEDMMQQKFRLDASKSEYIEMLNNIKERIIDQSDFINRIDEESVNAFQKQLEADKEHQVLIENIIDQKEEILDMIYNDIYYHLIELSNLEIESSGFITHIITCDEGTSFNKDTKVITFKDEGYAEIPIATTLRKWTDASQVRILPVVREG